MPIKRPNLKKHSDQNEKMTVQEAGRKGGNTTSERFGPNFYEEIGRKGGTETRELHGPNFYQEIGRKGGMRVRQLIEEGKRAKKEDTKDA